MKSPRLELWLYRLDRLGNPGKLGLILLVASVLGFLVFIAPAAIDTRSLQTEIKKRSDALSMRGAAGSTFSAPDASQDPEMALRQIFAAAAASGIALERGDYTMNSSGRSGSSVTRNASDNSIQISLPLKGTYPVIRQFIATVLNDNPAIAIEQIRLTRDSIDSEDLTATLRLVVFQGGRP